MADTVQTTSRVRRYRGGVLAFLAVLVVNASITDKLADFATRVVGDLGLPGIFLLMVPESACIPIPSEATMLFAGFNVSDGKYSLLAAVLVGTVANLVGSWIAYAVGYYGREGILEKHGRKLHIMPSHLAWADRWFTKYGSAAVFFSRMLPVIRTFISLPAGAARMPLGRFSVLTFLGALPWNFALVLAGRSARDNWTDIKDKLHYVDYAVVALVVVGAVYLLVRYLRNRPPAGPAVDPA
jgi:membrane protein DedA with SNARE-associated domain